MSAKWISEAAREMADEAFDYYIARRDWKVDRLIAGLAAQLERLLARHAGPDLEELARLQVQLAGCSVAAMGGARGNNDAKPGDYGWSVAFEDVKKLRSMFEAFGSYPTPQAAIVAATTRAEQAEARCINFEKALQRIRDLSDHRDDKHTAESREINRLACESGA